MMWRSGDADTVSHVKVMLSLSSRGQRAAGVVIAAPGHTDRSTVHRGSIIPAVSPPPPRAHIMVLLMRPRNRCVSVDLPPAECSSGTGETPSCLTAARQPWRGCQMGGGGITLRDLNWEGGGGSVGQDADSCDDRSWPFLYWMS